MKKGLFVGLATLDLIYLTPNFPRQNEKIVAVDDTIATGGPASNAAVAFAHLGNQANLLAVIGQHPISHLIKTDLVNYGVQIWDLEPQKLTCPPVSSIIVTQRTGERAVISLNATKSQAIIEQLPPDILEGIDIILIDGHQMAISEAIAQKAKAKNIPVVVDGGSWKKGFDRVLAGVDYAICSANFYPPNCHDQEDVLNYLQQMDIPNVAITQGEKPLIYWAADQRGKIPITPIKAVDTLGAGDIFHGAFCHYILQQNFRNALAGASKIASDSCQFFGTRKWMN
jgi:sugar/nucleoside kinase (ribokinase family)